MKIYLAIIALIFALAIPAAAVQTAAVDEGHGRISAYWHFIDSDADADSYSLAAELGLSGKTAVGIERIRIADDIGSLTLGSIYAKREIYQCPCDSSFQAAAYGGIRFLQGQSSIDGDMESDGVVLGLVAQKTLIPKLTAYGQAGVSFLEDTLGELEFTLGYRALENLEITGGYKTYLINGDSVNGFTAGVAVLF